MYNTVWLVDFFANEKRATRTIASGVDIIHKRSLTVFPRLSQVPYENWRCFIFNYPNPEVCEILTILGLDYVSFTFTFTFTFTWIWNSRNFIFFLNSANFDNYIFDLKSLNFHYEKAESLSIIQVITLFIIFELKKWFIYFFFIGSKQKCVTSDNNLFWYKEKFLGSKNILLN